MIVCSYCPESGNRKHPEQIAEHEPDDNWAMCKQCAMDESNGMLGTWKLEEQLDRSQDDSR